jgi:osmotically inducible protein OsmC
MLHQEEWKMPVRSANAVWQGTLREGRGTMKFGTFEGPYTYSSRFEEAAGTNPEELIGAAHAGCFSMALSGGLVRAGFPPERISTSAKVYVEKVGDGHKITHIDLDCEAVVPGIDEQTFQASAQAAKTGCPVSQALAATTINLNARLVK